MAELVYPPVVRTVLAYFKVMDYDIRIDGEEHIPTAGGGVIATNHIGYLDFVFAGLPAWRHGKRMVRFLAKKEIFDRPGVGALMRGMHHVAVDRDAGAQSYAEAVAALRRGELIGMFPEATISRSFVLKDFKAGAARMAIAADVPLIPIALWGTQRTLTKGRPRSWTRHLPIVIRVGEPLHAAPGEDAAALTARLKTDLGALLEKAQADYPAAPADADNRWWLPAHLGGTAPTYEQALAMDAADVRERREKRAAKAAARRGGKRGRG